MGHSVFFDDIELPDAVCASGVDLTTGNTVSIPIQLLSYPDYNATQEQRLRPFNSNGMAANTLREKAFESAIFEIIERDALMCRWYCSHQPQMFRIQSLPETAQNIVRLLDREGIEVFVVNVSTDIDIPSVAILARTFVSDEERWIGAGAARYTYTEAVEKALDELLMLKPNLYIDAVTGNNAHYYRGDLAKHIMWFISGDMTEMPRQHDHRPCSYDELIHHLVEHGVQSLLAFEYPRIRPFDYICAVKCICPQLCPFIFSKKDIPLCGTRLHRYCEIFGLPTILNEHPLFLN